MRRGDQDFEAFVGMEKAREFKALFVAWILEVYRAPFLESLLLTVRQRAPRSGLRMEYAGIGPNPRSPGSW